MHPAGGHFLNDRSTVSDCTLSSKGGEPVAYISVGVCLCCTLLGCMVWPLLCFRLGPLLAAASRPSPPGYVICHHPQALGIAMGSS